MNRRKRIVCDVDGVLVAFIEGLCAGLEKLGFKRKPQDFRSWSLEDSLTPEETRAALRLMAEPGFCHSLEMYDGAPEFFAALRQEGDVVVATAPFDASETWERERKAKMSMYIERKRVLPISGEFKHLLRGDILVEDHPGTAFEWLEENPDGVAILIDRPWNGPGAKEWQLHRRMYRVKSYDEALAIVRECT